jgi:serine phosphatase RsbU (regulator of sigma subunit)/anti-sigma regulatory factor (Ser/Thr protein kinase)
VTSVPADDARAQDARAGDAWDGAPCGLLVLAMDGAVLRANSTLLSWVGRSPEQVPGLRMSDLLSVGGRIYWETHLAPLLHVEQRLDEIALELRTSDGRMPVLVSATVTQAVDGRPATVHVAVSSSHERSRYERELLSARSAAEASERRVQVLQQTTAALSRALGVSAVADALLAAALGPLGAASATVWVAEREGGLHRLSGDEAFLPDSRLLLHERTAVRDGERVVVPLHGQSALQGLLAVTPRPDAGAEPVDLEVLTAIGQHCGLALDRAKLYEHSAGVARELQHSLLAVAAPADARFSIATTYRPGVEMLEVGGDWHDTFLVDGSVLGVVVGDVVGRGLRAASAMGQLRSAVRAIAAPGVGPARLLSRLDHFVEQVEAAGMATVAYGELDLASGRFQYSCAGHPPPLLLPARGQPRFLWDGRSVPLGAYVHPGARSEAELQLDPGDRLLLYTDGLVERRDEGIDDRLVQLLQAASAVRMLPLEGAVASLTAAMLEGEQVRDDVCVLLLSWGSLEFEHQLSADLTALAGTRGALSAWLLGRGVREQVANDVVLAASEAVANAAEHGAGWDRDAAVRLQVRLVLDRGAGEVVVVVRDSGRWRPPVSSLERGRGLSIMRGLVDDVSVDSEAGGTTVVLRRQLQQDAS